MRKETPLPVRLETEQRERLHCVREGLGLTPSNIVRMLIKSLIDHYDRHNGKIALPLSI